LPEVEFEEEHGRSSRGEGKNASLIPKIATIAVALAVVAFLVWWFNAERRAGDESRPGQVAATQAENPDTDPVAGGGEGAGMPVDTASGGGVADTLSAQGAAQATETQTTPALTLTEDPPVRPPPTGTETDPTGQTGAVAAIDSDDILVMDDLESKWGGSFLIHVSSFRGSDKARTEMSYLVDLDFPVFIVYIDLGAKGKWYRVYSGPFELREEARQAKKNLDDTPGVRFTRITQIPK
jgi:cell division septation protein DedD